MDKDYSYHMWADETPRESNSVWESTITWALIFINQPQITFYSKMNIFKII